MNTKEAIANTQLEIETAKPTTLPQLTRCIDAYLALETGYTLRVLLENKNTLLIGILVGGKDDNVIFHSIKVHPNPIITFTCVDAGYFTCKDEDLTILSPKQPLLTSGKTDSGQWELQYKGSCIATCKTKEDAIRIASKL